MTFFDDLQSSLDAVKTAVGTGLSAAEVPAAVAALADDVLLRVIGDATALLQGAECVRIAASGAVAARSTRELGHAGMAQALGHPSAVSLIQNLTGTTRVDATKQVRLGEALLSDTLPATPEKMTTASTPQRPWHAVLSAALLDRRLTKDQQHAILRGLGSPTRSEAGEADPDADSAAHLAWATAAEQLIEEAAERTAEELERAARTVRDLLDPEAASARFDRRFASRSFRVWADGDGGSHARIDFDDEMAAWVRTVIAAALRPRRGGPRFVDADEAARAKELEQDPRTNDQLTYDLMMDVLRAGVAAEPEAVFGTKQAGLRIVISDDARTAEAGGVPAIAVTEDDGATLPAWLAAQHICDTGTVSCTVDRDGNPLDLGREQRLFSPRQRVSLAIRDGGCRWRGCDRPASYTEAHHIDPWAGGGRTDIDRGILLCRYHHMALHHRGWRITRRGRGDFVLHAPPGCGVPSVLPPRLARRYAWGDLEPPPRRFRPEQRSA